jgi:hypothetical protein
MSCPMLDVVLSSTTATVGDRRDHEQSDQGSQANLTSLGLNNKRRRSAALGPSAPRINLQRTKFREEANFRYHLNFVFSNQRPECDLNVAELRVQGSVKVRGNFFLSFVCEGVMGLLSKVAIGGDAAIHWSH